MRIYYDYLPDLSGVQLALIGIGAKEANEVRKQLYGMSFPFQRFSRCRSWKCAETGFRLPHPLLLKELLSSNIVPILIGNDVAVAEAQYLAYQSLKQLINVAVVDEKIHYKLNSKNSKAYLNRILDNPRSHLFHLGIIGYQTHYVENAVLDYLTETKLRIHSSRSRPGPNWSRSNR